MKTRLYTKLRTMINELANKEISKSLFISTLREELTSYFPNRIFKIVDTSDTRYGGSNPHLPIMFIGINPTDEKDQTSYTFLVNIDRVGTTDVLTPDLLVGTIGWQLENIDNLTNALLTKLDMFEANIGYDFQDVLKFYLENHLELLKYLRESYPKDFSFGLLNGVNTSTLEIEMLIDRINFDNILDIDEEVVKVLDSKYHLPVDFLKLVKRVADCTYLD